jgi:hypothetical protein
MMTKGFLSRRSFLSFCAGAPPTIIAAIRAAPARHGRISDQKAAVPRAATHSPINSLETIVDDMTLPHEGRPHGVPDSYDWARHPVMGMGNHPPAAWRAITAWGQLYEDASGNPASNTRVGIRLIRTYLLSKRDGKWRLVQSSDDVHGAAYREDFVNDTNHAAGIRREPGGGVSVHAGGGFNFHFWPSTGRAEMEAADIAGVFTTVEARLIVDDPAKPDDRQSARYLLSMGGDYWLDRKAEWYHFKTNQGIATGRFKVVRVNWQAFNMTTLNREQLNKNRPPLE